MMVMLCVDILMAFMMCVNMNLCWWLNCENGCTIWFSSKYMLIQTCFGVFLMVCSIVNNSAYNSTLRMFGYMGNLAAMCTCSGPLKTPTPTMFPFLWLSRDLNEYSM